MSTFNLFKKNFDSFKEVLANAPGPSPWYLHSVGPKVISKHGTLVWSAAGEDEISAGKMLLKTRNGDVLAVFDFHCYVLPMDHNKLLVWHEEKERLGASPVVPGFIKLLILDVDGLEIIGDTRTAFEEMKGKGIKVFNRGGELSSYLVPASLSEGHHELKLPDEFMELDEILILAHSTADEKTSNFYDEMYLCLFIIRPKETSVEVVPQEWFNKGPYDFGYQWVTRVARDPETGKIFGEGIRLGAFVLDDSLRQVAKWLHTDNFYHPER